MAQDRTHIASESLGVSLTLRLLAGAMIALLALVLVSAGALLVLQALVSSTQSLNATSNSAELLADFAADLEGVEAALNSSTEPSYRATFYHYTLGQAKATVSELRGVAALPNSSASAEIAQLTASFDSLSAPGCCERSGPARSRCG